MWAAILGTGERHYFFNSNIFTEMCSGGEKEVKNIKNFYKPLTLCYLFQEFKKNSSGLVKQGRDEGNNRAAGLRHDEGKV